MDRLIRLSNALLFLSRSEQQRLSWEPAHLNLAEILEVIVEQVRPLAEERHQKLRSTLPEKLAVYGDKDHLIRLFLNLLDNAVKYTPPEGMISLDAIQTDTHVEVVLRNSGEGISPEHLPHIFKRFYRVDPDRSSETGGSGLGLAISREIVQLHDGTIDVQSEPGEGVCFTVTLPVQDDRRR